MKKTGNNEVKGSSASPPDHPLTHIIAMMTGL